jgi:hypothetical protein
MNSNFILNSLDVFKKSCTLIKILILSELIILTLNCKSIFYMSIVISLIAMSLLKYAPSSFKMRNIAYNQIKFKFTRYVIVFSYDIANLAVS